MKSRRKFFGKQGEKQIKLQFFFFIFFKTRYKILTHFSKKKIKAHRFETPCKKIKLNIYFKKIFKTDQLLNNIETVNMKKSVKIILLIFFIQGIGKNSNTGAPKPI